MNTKQYTCFAGTNETKPFSTFDEAKSFAKAWFGQFSIFSEIGIKENGLVMKTFRSISDFD